ncbi:MAG: metallophosphoesterase, partial [Planctomycetota bacterium]
MKKHLLLTLAVAALSLAGAAHSQEGVKKPPSSKTAVRFAIGDIHGDYKSFVKLLGRLGLVDRDLKWLGGKKELVQTGDIFDRGPGSRAAVELLMKLEGEAKKAGGEVTTLLGNHEVMNLVGDLRYVDPREYTAFAADETAALRARKKASILGLPKTSAGLLRSNYYAQVAGKVNAAAFDTNFPPGFFAHREAFSLRGKIGAWLVTRNTVYLKDRNLFVHGGISPRVSGILPATINSSVKTDLVTYLKASDQLEKLGVFDLSLGVHELFLLLAGERAAGGVPHPMLAASFATLERIKNTS